MNAILYRCKCYDNLNLLNLLHQINLIKIVLLNICAWNEFDKKLQFESIIYFLDFVFLKFRMFIVHCSGLLVSNTSQSTDSMGTE